LQPGLKTGVGNGIFWSEIGSGFGDAGGTPPPKIPRSTPPGHEASQQRTQSKQADVKVRNSKLFTHIDSIMCLNR